MLVLGMDPGSLSFGIGVVKREKKEIHFVHSQTVKLAGRDIYERMQALWEGLNGFFRSYVVQEAAMEEGFLGKNVRSQSVLAMVRGVAMASLIAQGVHLRFYSPREVKQSLTGYGNAGKPQIERMVGLLLNPPKRISGSDENDALAVAYCHALNLK